MKPQFESDLVDGRSAMLVKVERWLAEPDTIVGVFECVDLGSAHIGSRFGLAFDRRRESELVIGRTRAPDRPEYGLGWRFVLQLKSTDPEEVVSFVLREPAAPAAEGV